MASRIANRIRPSLDALETREVCAAALSSAFAGLGTMTHAAPIHAGPKFALPVWDSAFELTNETKQTLHLRVRWEASGTVQTYTLAPGQTEAIWIMQVERIPANQFADVRVVNGPTSLTGHVFRVKAAVVPAGSDGPQAPGPAYMIEPGAKGGISLKGI
jgi:hypothetical protein